MRVFALSRGVRLLWLLSSNAGEHGDRASACGREVFPKLEHDVARRRRSSRRAPRDGVVAGVLVMLGRKARRRGHRPVGIGFTAPNKLTRLPGSTYYSLIAHAIQAGTRRIYYGRGMYEVKVRRGCRLAATWIYTRESGLRRLGSAAWFVVASAWNRYSMPRVVRRSLMD